MDFSSMFKSGGAAPNNGTPTNDGTHTWSSNPGSPQAGNGSNNYGSLTNRWRNGVIDSGNQAGQSEQNAGGSRNQFLDLLNQDPSKTLESYVNGAMGSFNKAIQGQRESSIQRGIGTGDLGTAYEGSIDSAFQKNIASEAAGLYGKRLDAAGGLYGQDSSNSQNDQNRYLDTLQAQSDQSTQKKNAHNSFLGGLLNTAVGGAKMLMGGG